MAERLLIALVAALALIGGGYWWGHTATDNAWTARQADEKERTDEALRQETVRADNAAGMYLQEHFDQEDRYATLDRQYQELRKRGIPLTVRPPVAAASACACATPTPAQGRIELPAAAAGDAEPVLSLGAVRMWNGALTGVDAPAGACGPAGATEEADAACAEASGLTLDDAWANHTANAKSCAADRQRYQALIDFLNHRQTP